MGQLAKIEDELMGNKELQNRDETLLSKNQSLASVFHKNGREDFAIVLLLREIMHHLRFDAINIED
jgi:hypothetical protein